jgi:hypothetical protein
MRLLYSGEAFDTLLEQIILSQLDNRSKDYDSEYVATDSLGEVVEKLAILHIRMWMLEDRMAEAKTDAEIADIKRKLDICFKQKRPKYVEAINRLVDDAVSRGKSLKEDSVKIYKG